MSPAWSGALSPSVALRVLSVVLLAGLAGCELREDVSPATNQSAAEPGAADRGAEDARRVIETEAAPPAIGPYSQGILVDRTLYLAGQIALDPATGEMVEGGIEEETHRVMRNLEAVLEAAGFGLEDVVQSQVFLVELDDFAAMNEVYGSYFPGDAPVRATVEVAGLPAGARVEIMMTAVR